MQLLPMQIEHIDDVIRIHKIAFSRDHFTSRLSKDLLRKFYLKQIENNSFCYVATVNNTICGFIVAGENTSAAVKEFTSENSTGVIKTLLMNPKFLVQKIAQIFNRDTFASEAKIRLLSIAVNIQLELKGIGTFLIKEFEKELQKNNKITYGLSVKKSNKNAVKFYEKHGFIREHDIGSALYYIRKL